jgi:hypothetical protein
MKLGGLLDTSSQVCGQFLSQNFDIIVSLWDISMDEGCLK